MPRLTFNRKDTGGELIGTEEAYRREQLPVSRLVA